MTINPVNTHNAKITPAYLAKRRWSNSTSPVAIRAFDFPSDFDLGGSTAASQIEGINGRGLSHWESYFERFVSFEESGERISCERGVDHYHRWKEDIRHMKRMGLTSYRFSVSWPRIMPHEGELSEVGLAFYDGIIDELLANGIKPNLTCYHWDLPQWAADKGGWLNRHTAELFAEYCTVLAKRFGDRVKMWGTINEPEVIVAGYIGTGLAPALDDYKMRVHAAHGVMLGHALGLKALRAVGGSDFQIGITLNLVPQEPIDADNVAAVAACERRWQSFYSLYLDAIFKGRYPDVVLDEARETGVDIQPGDLASVNQPIDWLGVNWYLRHVVDEKGDVVPNRPEWDVTLMGWEIHAPAFTRMLVRMNSDYKLPPIYITENGCALKDTLENGRIRDVGRMQYLHDHLEALEAACKAGVPIAGYYVWSLLDNLEWSCGYKMTFGIIHVNRKNMRRTWKDSAYWYRATIKATKKRHTLTKR